MDNKKHREDDYLAMSKYEGRPPSKDHKGFGTFSEGDDHYFVLNDKAGKAFMRSEGYSSEKARDNGIESVKKNSSLRERWSISEMRNHFFLSLKAGNHQEIAKSGAYKTKGEAEAALNAWLGGGKAAAAGIASGVAVATGVRRVISEKRNELPLGKVLKENRKVIGEKRNVIGEKSRKVIGEKRNVINETRNLLSSTRAGIREDDYLKCEAYKGHKVTDTKNNIAFFTGEDKQQYFVVYNRDGSVRLRSEGFQSTANRDDELKEVIKHMDNEKMYKTLKRGKYFINVLRDKSGREVARSCMSASAMSRVAYVAPVIAAASIARKEVVQPAPVAPLSADAGGCAWWIPLLFLLPLLLHLCIPTPPPPPPPPPVKKVVPPPPPPPVCNCADLTHPIFKIPPGPAPKTTTVLGRAPEYGNSHALSPNQFFDKLDNKFKGSQMEKDFLNGIFKQMGYENGWADAKPGMFTAVNVPRGVEGNLGTKVTHKTVYRKLDPTNVRDLKAFRIEAKNHCHLHFMKTCGNHFYFGECE